MARTTMLNDDPARDASRRRLAERSLALCLLACAAAVESAGCSGRTSYITGGPTNGQLKTSLSRLEYENDQLKTQVARLKEENRTMEDRLVQEQLHTGTLTARLNDVQNVMRDGGLEVEPIPDRPRTLPAGRRTTKPRKPPTAQIPSDDYYDDDPPPLILDDEPTPRSSSTSSSSSGSGGGRTRSRSQRPAADDSVSLHLDDDAAWLPVANDPKAKPPAKR